MGIWIYDAGNGAKHCGTKAAKSKKQEAEMRRKKSTASEYMLFVV